MKNTLSALKNNKKNMLLSLVALILVICLLTGITYSWIDNISTISVTDTENTLTIDSATDSVVTVETGGDKIDLGSYFNKSGNMHLTACSGNGKDFYFRNFGSDTYRLGTANDVNVNYISCTFKIKALENTVYWFDSAPTLMSGDKDLSKYLSCAVTVDGDTILMSGSENNDKKTDANSPSDSTDTVDADSTSDNTGEDSSENDGKYTYVSSTSGSKVTVDANSTNDYTWEYGSDYLFFIDKDATKTVNIKLWIENPEGDKFANGDDLALGLMLIASPNTQLVYFKDNTFDPTGGMNFVMESNSSLHIALTEDPDDYWTFGKVEGEDNTYVAELPIIYRKHDVFILRCDGNYSTGNRIATINGHRIACDHYWETKLSGGIDSVTFTVLGNGFYNIQTADATNTGVWAECEKVYVDDQYGLDVTKTMALTDNDGESGDANYKNNMYYNTDKGYWEGYILPTSTKLEFTADGNSWGYCEATNNQEKPDSSDMYIIYDKGIGTWTTYSYWENNISPYVLMGDFNEWKGTPMLYSNKSGSMSYASIELEQGTYSFKIYSNNSESWYGSTTSASLSLGDSSSTSKSATLSNAATASNVSLKINSSSGGTVLFTFAGNTHIITVQFIPSLPTDSDVRSYVMLNSSWGANWLTQINHWEETEELVEYPKRSVNYASDYQLTHINNLFTMNSSWDGASGSWSYKGSNNDKEIFFDPWDSWVTDGARFAVYVFNSSKNSWVSLSDGDGDGIYSGILPDGDWTGADFVRMNGSTTANNWNNKWNQTADISLTNKGTTTVTYKLYYVDLDTDATYLQWGNSSDTFCPDRDANKANIDDGYNMGNPVNGALYFMASDDADYGCGTITDNIQEAPTLTASETSTTVGTVVTLTASGSSTGVAYKGVNYSYYVKNNETGTTRVVSSSWTPNVAGTYTITARANDGYIATAESEAITVTVTE